MPDHSSIVFVAALAAVGAVMLASGNLFLPGLAAAVAGFTMLWVVSLAMRNASIVDIAWGPGFVVGGSSAPPHATAGIASAGVFRYSGCCRKSG